MAIARGRLLLGALLPLLLLLGAGVLQHERAGVESGLLRLVPGVVAAVAWSLVERRRTADSWLATAAALAALLLGLVAYPVPELAATLLYGGLVLAAALAALPRARPALGTWLGAHATGVERAVFAGFVAFAALSLALSFHTYNAFDEGLEIVPATQILEGAVPFRDFYCYRLPGHELALAAWFFLAGTTDLAARVWTMLLVLLGVVSVAAIARRTLALPARLVAVAYAVFALVPSGRVASHWNFSVALCLAGCALVVVAARRPSLAPLRLVAGLLVGTATCATWSLGFLTAFALVVAALVSEGARGERLRAAAWIALGAALPPLVLVGVLCRLGAGPLMYQDLVVTNSTGYVRHNAGMPYFYNGWPLVSLGASEVREGAFLLGLARVATVLLVGLGMPLAALLALAQGARALVRGTDVRRLSAAGCAVALLLATFSLPSWQALLRASPLAVVTLLAAERALLAGRGRRLGRTLAVSVLVAAGVMALDGARAAWVERAEGVAVRTRRGDTILFPDAASAQAFRDLDAQLDALPGGRPKSAFVLFHEPGWHFHLTLPPWYRAPNFLPVLFTDEEELAQRLRDDPAPAVIYSERFVRASYRFGDPRFVKNDPGRYLDSVVSRAIRERYRPVAHFDALAFGDGEVILYVPR